MLGWIGFIWFIYSFSIWTKFDCRCFFDCFIGTILTSAHSVHHSMWGVPLVKYTEHKCQETHAYWQSEKLEILSYYRSALISSLIHVKKTKNERCRLLSVHPFLVYINIRWIQRAPSRMCLFFVYMYLWGKCHPISSLWMNA